MGTDKALLQFQGEPLLKRMISLIEPFCDTLAISGQNPEYSVFNVSMIPDCFAGSGPISGLYSVLNSSSTEWNLVVSVDVPFVNDELISSLIASRLEYDCVVPKHIGGVEPLIAMYHKRCLPHIEEMISSGDFKLMNVLEKLNVRYLDCTDMEQKYPRLFYNLNHKKDFESL